MQVLFVRQFSYLPIEQSYYFNNHRILLTFASAFFFDNWPCADRTSIINFSQAIRISSLSYTLFLSLSLQSSVR